ncbi:MAG TPA: DUF2281 domain-containing protein [Nostocaceae cyanobacterium]|nr:DUF2281 domain-containing protein [Nostocaceae cyanobacterium]
MDSLKERILNKLEHLPENAQQEVLNFIEFLEWRKDNHQELNVSIIDESELEWLESDLSNLGSYDDYEWQPEELNQGLPIKFIPDQGLIIIEKSSVGFRYSTQPTRHN